jgi:hypothetical protein
MRRDAHRNTLFKLAILWLAILALGGFWLSMRNTSDQATMIVLPQVPREGEPIVITFKLNNPSSEPLVTKYQLYANGKLLEEGNTSIAPDASKTYHYAYNNLLSIGEQLTFALITRSNKGSCDKVVSLPAYPPQILSSFVNFASFSTSVMTSMSTMAYYRNTFGTNMGFNIGIITSAVLIALLFFLELPFTRNEIQGKLVGVRSTLRIRLSSVTWILVIIFMAMTYTTVMLIITGS